MEGKYDVLLELANKLGYREFTELQKLAFQSEDLYNPDRDIFVIGETSSGKTLIPILLYYAELLKAKQERTAIPRMLFVVPYRALAAQKKAEIQKLFDGEDICVVQSTGEYRQDDEEIQIGGVDIAVIISEKVYKCASKDLSFLSKYDFLVIDEAGLLSDNERGVRIDFILAWAYTMKLHCNKPKIIMLGTPFYNWDSYIKNYNFIEIKASGRPIELIKHTVLYDKSWGVLHTEENNPCISRSRMMSSSFYHRFIGTDENPMICCEYCPEEKMLCPVLDIKEREGAPFCPYISQTCKSPVTILPDGCRGVQLYILSQICRYHLKRNQQILIFWNNREEVRRLCKELYLILRDELPKQMGAEECKENILSACGINEDDIYGVLEDGSLNENEKYIYYEAMASGIGFHSSAVPNELRTYIEQNLLQGTKLKVVCSTETLAFGVNSNVDVVILADLIKQNSQVVRYLTLNEYQNYIGRAGRNSKQRVKSENKGFVYTMVKKKQEHVWDKLMRDAAALPRLYSLFFQDTNDKIPMLVLNLFTNESSKLTIGQLSQVIQLLPKPEEYDDSLLNGVVQEAVDFLVGKGLIQRQKQKVHGRMGQNPQQSSYCLTLYGTLLRGYILGTSDYELLYKAVKEQTDKGIWQDIDIATMLYRLLLSKHAAGCLGGLYHNTRADIDIEVLYNNLKDTYPGQDVPDWLAQLDIRDKKQGKTLHLLVSLIKWMDSENPKAIFRTCKIHYAIVSKLGEQLSYLLEIGKVMLRNLLTEQWGERSGQLKQLGIDEEGFEEEIAKKEAWMHKIYCSLYYGINVEVWEKLLGYLEGCPDEESHVFADVVSPSRINPDTARQLRKAAVRYRFFQGPSRAYCEDVELRNNYKNQRWQYQEDIHRMGKHYHGFFTEMFGQKYLETD